MKFANFEGLQKDKFTTEVCVGDIVLDLRNEWSLVDYIYYLPSTCFILQWQHIFNPNRICHFEFNGVRLVRIEPRDPDYPLEEAEALSNMLYQENELTSVKFWFQDESTIEIGADQLTIKIAPEMG